MTAWWQRLGVSDPDLSKAYRHINGFAPEFAAEAAAIESGDGKASSR
jgi:hypothetical protein